MCHDSCIHFGKTNLKASDIEGKAVLEVGALDVNGSLRPYVESFAPSSYIGVDIATGKGVDLICDATKLVKKFGKEAFDILISTELLEHVKDWRKAVGNFKNVIKPGGIILVTTRSMGFEFHNYPFDYWRYEISDLKNIFTDMVIEILEEDKLMPGVFIRARKPVDFKESGLKDYKLYSIVNEKTRKKIYLTDILWFKFKYKVRPVLSKWLPQSLKVILKKMIFR